MSEVAANSVNWSKCSPTYDLFAQIAYTPDYPMAEVTAGSEVAVMRFASYVRSRLLRGLPIAAHIRALDLMLAEVAAQYSDAWYKEIHASEAQEYSASAGLAYHLYSKVNRFVGHPDLLTDVCVYLSDILDCMRKIKISA